MRGHDVGGGGFGERDVVGVAVVGGDGGEGYCGGFGFEAGVGVEEPFINISIYLNMFKNI